MKIEDSADKQREMIVILRFVANGKTAEEIGMLTNASSFSVRRKLRWWQDKLQVFNNAALVHAGHCHGVLVVADDERRDFDWKPPSSEFSSPLE